MRETRRDAIMMPTALIRTDWPPNGNLTHGTGYDHYERDVYESIRCEGIREPLTINLGWTVIDGHHRIAAARELGIEWVPVRVWTGSAFLPPFAKEALGHE